MLGPNLPSAFYVVADDKNNDAGSASGSESSTSEDVSSSGVHVAAGEGGALCLNTSIGGTHNSLGFAAGQHHLSSSAGSENSVFHGNSQSYQTRHRGEVSTRTAHGGHKS